MQRVADISLQIALWSSKVITRSCTCVAVALEVFDGISTNDFANEFSGFSGFTGNAEAIVITQRASRLLVDTNQPKRQKPVDQGLMPNSATETDGTHLVFDVANIRVALCRTV